MPNTIPSTWDPLAPCQFHPEVLHQWNASVRGYFSECQPDIHQWRLVLVKTSRWRGFNFFLANRLTLSLFSLLFVGFLSWLYREIFPLIGPWCHVFLCRGLCKDRGPLHSFSLYGFEMAGWSQVLSNLGMILQVLWHGWNLNIPGRNLTNVYPNLTNWTPGGWS